MQANPENRKQTPARDNEEVLLFIFKTNIALRSDLEKIRRVLRKREGIISWTLDQEDIDKVLRVKTRTMAMEEIMELVKKGGFEIEELEG